MCRARACGGRVAGVWRACGVGVGRGCAWWVCVAGGVGVRGGWRGRITLPSRLPALSIRAISSAEVAFAAAARSPAGHV